MSICFVTVEVEIDVCGPLLVKSSEAGPWGVDVCCLRDRFDRLLIPGSELLGLYRLALEQLGLDPMGASTDGAGADQVRSLGYDKKASGIMPDPTLTVDGSKPPSKRFPVWFSDANSLRVWPPAGQQTISMSAVDESTGASEDMSLRTFDCPVGVGESAKFRFDVVAATEESKVHTFVNVLEAALNGALNYVGSHRSVGFGRVDQLSILGTRARVLLDENVQQHSVINHVWSEAAADFFEPNASDEVESWRDEYLATFEVEWMVRDLFCLTEGLINGNIHESVSSIRGDVLRGSLATVLKRGLGIDSTDNRGHGENLANRTKHLLCEAFESLSFSDAHLIGNRHAPRSLVVQNGNVFDMALVGTEAENASSILLNGEPPRFQPDWKQPDWTLVRRAFPWREPRRELRVRTEIEHSKRRSKEGQLFAQRLIDPAHERWHGTVSIDLRKLGPQDDGPSQKERFRQLFTHLERLLSSGHMTIGKTKARISGKVVRATPCQDFVDASSSVDKCVGDGQPIVVMLASHARMLGLGEASKLTTAPGELTSAYKTTFRELSDDIWSLRRCFVGHRLIGGFRAWQEASVRNQAYNPILLTSPGSVFVLEAEKGKRAAAARCVARWLSHGLVSPGGDQLLDEADQESAGQFVKTFTVQNGYGQIKLLTRESQSRMPPSERTEMPKGVIQ